MKDIINNIVQYKLAIGQPKEEVLSGLFHTICNSLGLTHAEALIIIRRADDQKRLSDAILDAYKPDHEGLRYNSLTGSRIGRTYPNPSDRSQAPKASVKPSEEDQIEDFMMGMIDTTE